MMWSYYIWILLKTVKTPGISAGDKLYGWIKRKRQVIYDLPFIFLAAGVGFELATFGKCGKLPGN